MEWNDNAIILSTRKHGETSLIVNMITHKHGRYAGLVRGGAGKRNRGVYQPGNYVRVKWRGRLQEHLGLFSCELEKANIINFKSIPLSMNFN